MSYIKPDEVQGPQDYWKLDKIIYEGKEGEWSAAEGRWKNNGTWEKVLAIRWNGETGREIGNPQSRGHATWFIVPNEVAGVLREVISLLPKP